MGLAPREEKLAVAASTALCWAIVFAQNGVLFNVHNLLGIAIAAASIPAMVAIERFLTRTAQQ
jgi:hypothetical protein